MAKGAEARRLAESTRVPWKRWGPYVSERQWGTVREDYSPDGSSWRSTTHDMARSLAYRWGEDAIAGICDEQQILCIAPAIWNGKDPILKERLFGLDNHQGNHGEDVKEVYAHLDSTPTHSYMRYLYRYPQAEFPYRQLVEMNARRSRAEREYELADTGVLEDGRYFDVVMEFAKVRPEHLLIRYRVRNCGNQACDFWMIPQVWFRNTWAWGGDSVEAPVIESRGGGLICANPELGVRYVYFDSDAQTTPKTLFTNNETNRQRLYRVESATRYVKDAFHEYVVNGRADAVSPQPKGTKAGILYPARIEAGSQLEFRLVVSDRALSRAFSGFDANVQKRAMEADAFYDAVHSPGMTPEEKLVQRRALSGLLWSKQFYYYDVYKWLDGDPNPPRPAEVRKTGRNGSWSELYAQDVICMPDKWEYPWFAAWDQAFHAIPLALVDIQLAKQQMELLISEQYMHPNGQIPAYEWAFSDVNPPVQAWAVWRVYNMEKHAHGEKGDLEFLERCYHKLLMNFTWWVNRKDRDGRNIFEGGFLGLDNISIFDRSQPMPGGGWIEQADGTGWMALFCLNLMAIGLELAQKERIYEHLGSKFFEHFMHIAAAVNRDTAGHASMWNEEDGWYYDIAHETSEPGGVGHQVRLRSLVGMVPLFAAQVLEEHWFENLPFFRERYEWLLENRPEFAGSIVCTWAGNGHKCLLSIVSEQRLRRILNRVLDEAEFLSDYGVRSLSRYHLEHPFDLACRCAKWRVGYEPAEATSALYGGNSNWRGPVWVPTNFMLITALRVYDRFFGKDFRVEIPGKGQLTLNACAMEIATRISRLFLPDATGRRPAMADGAISGAWGEAVFFHEYFDAETGRGLGASHQTGWTALVAKMMEQEAKSKPASK